MNCWITGFFVSTVAVYGKLDGCPRQTAIPFAPKALGDVSLVTLTQRVSAVMAFNACSKRVAVSGLRPDYSK